MSRLKLIGAALLLVIFDMYTASADSHGTQSSMVQTDPALYFPTIKNGDAAQ